MHIIPYQAVVQLLICQAIFVTESDIMLLHFTSSQQQNCMVDINFNIITELDILPGQHCI